MTLYVVPASLPSANYSYSQIPPWDDDFSDPDYAWPSSARPFEAYLKKAVQGLKGGVYMNFP
jgi:hypothetical protein